jgi:Bacterial membrane protein YfhO
MSKRGFLPLFLVGFTRVGGNVRVRAKMNSDQSGLRKDFDREFTAPRLALLLGILILIYCPGIVDGSHALFFRDAGQFGYPVGMYVRERLLHGEIPLWNPYADCGVPFLAQWLTLALYPLSLIYVLLPFPWSMNLFILAHVFLAGIGMYYLAGKWFGNRFAASVAGLAFAWNGLMLHSWMWPSLIATIAWMPWVVLLCERARVEGGPAIWWAALAGAMQMLTGSPEEIVYTWLIVLASFAVNAWPQRTPLDPLPSSSSDPLAPRSGERAGERGSFMPTPTPPIIAQPPWRAYWRGSWRLAGVVILVTGLASAQLFPYLDFLSHGDRNTSAGGNAWSMPIWGAANFLVPLFRVVQSISGVCMQPDQAWVSSYYVGIVTLLLALLGIFLVRSRLTILLGVITVATILCAMGDAGVFLKIFRTLLPFLGITRYPVKYIVITDFCLPLLAAAGVVWLQGRTMAAARRSLVLTGGILAIGIVLLAFCIPFPENSQSLVAMNGVGRLLVLAAGIGAILYQPFCQEKMRQLLVSFAFLLLMGIDICTHVPTQNPTVRSSDYDRTPPAMTRVPVLGEARTMLAKEPKVLLLGLYGRDLEDWFAAQRALLYGNLNLLDDVPGVNGFFPLHPKEESAVAKLLYQGAELPRLQEFLGVSQLCTNLFVWRPQTDFLPMAMIGQQPIYADDAGTLKGLASPDFAPQRMVYLPLPVSNAVTAVANAEAKVLSSNFTAERDVVQTESDGRALLVIAQTYYHWWKATVDGVATPLLRANEGFQAVEVPAGRHEVRLVYQDRSFQLGAAISVLTLSLCAAGFWKSKKSVG